MADAEESQQAAAAPEGEQQEEVKPEEATQEATDGEAATADTQQTEAEEGQQQQQQEETTEQQEESPAQQEVTTADNGGATEVTEQQAEQTTGGEEQAEKTEEGAQESESAPEVAQEEAKEEAKEDEKEEQKEEEKVETDAQPAQQEETKEEEKEKEVIEVEEDVSQQAQQEEEEVKVNGDVEQVNGTADHQDEVVEQMSSEQREMCQKLFDKKAVGGRVDLAGFKVVFRLTGQVLSSEDASTMFEEGAKDANGTIDFDEFCRLHAKFSQAEQERKEAVANSIEKLFPKSDGEPVELKKVESLLLKLQQPDLSMRLVREKSDLGKDDVKKLVRSMDKQGNGLISKNEFVETLCSHLQL